MDAASQSIDLSNVDLPADTRPHSDPDLAALAADMKISWGDEGTLLPYCLFPEIPIQINDSKRQQSNNVPLSSTIPKGNKATTSPSRLQLKNE